MLARGVHRCERCGAQRIRRARAHTPWQKFVRWLTPFERYACGDCGHRGWRVPSEGPKPAIELGLAPRPLEPRDHRKIRKARRNLVRSVLVAVVLGILAAVVFVLGE